MQFLSLCACLSYLNHFVAIYHKPSKPEWAPWSRIEKRFLALPSKPKFYYNILSASDGKEGFYWAQTLETTSGWNFKALLLSKLCGKSHIICVFPGICMSCFHANTLLLIFLIILKCFYTMCVYMWQSLSSSVFICTQQTVVNNLPSQLSFDYFFYLV